MNTWEFKTVEECNARLTWLEVEIIRVAENIKLGFVSKKSDMARRGEALKREQLRMFKHREKLRTNELPLDL
jgi:hypothetical protein